MALEKRMLSAFEGSKVAHGTTTVGRIGRNGKADAESRIVREPLTLEIMQGHIQGEQGVGAIPINEDNQCRWGVLDIDIYDLDHNELQARIQKQKLPLLHCRSKSGGAHLYLFLEEYEQAKVVREYLLEMAVALGHSGCEIFQSKIGFCLNVGMSGTSSTFRTLMRSYRNGIVSTTRLKLWNSKSSWMP